MSALALPLGTLLETLRGRAAEQLARKSPESAFAVCFLGADIPPQVEGEVVKESDHVEAVERGESPALAIEGYKLWSARSESPFGPPASWAKGMDRLSKRDPFALDRQTFAFRPFELVGIAAGIARVGVHSDWLGNVLSRLGKDHNLTSRQRLFLGLAHSLARAGKDPQTAIPLEGAAVGLGELALGTWLSTEFEIPVRIDGLSPGEDPTQVLLRRSLIEPTDSVEGAEAIMLSKILRAAVRDAVDELAADAGRLGLRTKWALREVVSMCRRFDVSARQLQSRHASRTTLTMSDEYDVQDLLHVLLLSRFDDVRPEEWTPSYAGKSARTDFLLKREEVFIEAKKTRPALRDREVTEQLAVDLGFYRQHPNCRALVCFVYDPDHLLKNPAAIEADLSGVRDGLSVQVVVCPRGS